MGLHLEINSSSLIRILSCGGVKPGLLHLYGLQFYSTLWSHDPNQRESVDNYKPRKKIRKGGPKYHKRMLYPK